MGPLVLQDMFKTWHDESEALTEQLSDLHMHACAHSLQPVEDVITVSGGIPLTGGGVVAQCMAGAVSMTCSSRQVLEAFLQDSCHGTASSYSRRPLLA